jgi:hypothetical protein
MMGQRGGSTTWAASFYFSGTLPRELAQFFKTVNLWNVGVIQRSYCYCYRSRFARKMRAEHAASCAHATSVVDNRRMAINWLR